MPLNFTVFSVLTVRDTKFRWRPSHLTFLLTKAGKFWWWSSLGNQQTRSLFKSFYLSGAWFFRAGYLVTKIKPEGSMRPEITRATIPVPWNVMFKAKSLNYRMVFLYQRINVFTDILYWVCLSVPYKKSLQHNVLCSKNM